jgi:hypothetical protein
MVCTSECYVPKLRKRVACTKPAVHFIRFFNNSFHAVCSDCWIAYSNFNYNEFSSEEEFTVAAVMEG